MKATQPVMFARSPFFSSQNRYPKISSVYFGGKAVKLHSRAFSTSRGTTTLTHWQKNNRLLGNNGVGEVETIGCYGRGILSCHSIWRSCHSHVTGDVIWIRPISIQLWKNNEPQVEINKLDIKTRPHDPLNVPQKSMHPENVPAETTRR